MRSSSSPHPHRGTTAFTTKAILIDFAACLLTNSYANARIIMADNDAILDKCACTEADEHDGGIQADQHCVSASRLNDFLFHTLRPPTLLIYPL